MNQNARKNKRAESWSAFLLPLAGLIVCFLLLGFLLIGPLLLARHLGLWVGFVGAVIAVPAWIYLGPRPTPGLIPGIIALSGLFGLLLAAVLAFIRAIIAGIGMS
jgi:hypothetical protein